MLSSASSRTLTMRRLIEQSYKPTVFPQVPNLGRGDAGAGNSSGAGDPTLLPKRRLFYWSVRFAHWDSCRYMAEWTAALQNASGDPTLQTYVRPHPKASNRPSDLTAALLAGQVNWNNCRRRAPQLLPALP